MCIACRNGHFDIAEELLVKGAEVNQADNDVNTPLFIACQEGHFDIAELLLKKNAEPTAFKTTKES